MSKIWVIAAGDDTRDLVPNMVLEGVMMIGPGTTGDISGQDANMVDAMLRRNEPDEANDYTRNLLIRFRDEPKEGNLVVLRLGSVCFAVGAIAGDYRYDKHLSAVLPYANPKNCFQPAQSPWNLSHVRDVSWYALKNQQAIYLFRQGIYQRKRFYRLGEGGDGNPNEKTRRALRDYLNKMEYDGTNGQKILDKIGEVCCGVDDFGWPSPKKA